MKIVRFNGCSIGVTDGRKIVDVSALRGITLQEWPPVGINRLFRDFASLRRQLERALVQEAGVALSGARPETPETPVTQ